MKQQYDSIFDNLDKSKKGHLSPDQVASILMTSKLNSARFGVGLGFGRYTKHWYFYKIRIFYSVVLS